MYIYIIYLVSGRYKTNFQLGGNTLQAKLWPSIEIMEHHSCLEMGVQSLGIRLNS